MPTVLITGAGSGIGMLAALEFARRDGDVYAAMRNVETKAKELLDLAAGEQLEVHPIELDVTSDDSVDQGMRQVLDRAGSIDVLVNNAGLGSSGAAETVPDEIARRTFETNFWGPVRMVRAVAPSMRERRSGHIITVSSILARVPGMLSSGWYCATKHALSTWMESFAMEASMFGIKATLIEPGTYRTPMADKALEESADPAPGPYQELERQLHAAIEGGRATLGEPSEVAQAIADAAYADAPPAWRLLGDDAAGLYEAYRTMPYDEYQKMMAGVTDMAAS